MSKTGNDTTPPAYWVEIFQQTLVNLAGAGFTIQAGNSKTPNRLSVTVDGLRRCTQCGDLAIATETINDHCGPCQRS